MEIDGETTKKNDEYKENPPKKNLSRIQIKISIVVRMYCLSVNYYHYFYYY